MTTYCDVNTCEDCPRYGDDCDGDKRVEHTDYISRADAMEEFREWVKRANENGETPTWNDAVSLIGSLLSADALQGEWIEVEDYNGDVHYKCDQCGEEWTFPFGTPKENNANFCPNCGARMYKGGEE